MYAVRVSKTAPHAYRSLREAVTDERLDGSEDLYVHIEPGEYEETRSIRVFRQLLVVPTEGPGTVRISAAGDDGLFHVRGALELYGLLVRSASAEPVVTASEAGRVKLADCVFDTASALRLGGRHSDDEVVNCRFENGGIVWHGGGGQLSDCHFERAVLHIQYGAEATVHSVEFTGYLAGGENPLPTLGIRGATAKVTDCVLTDAGPVGSSTAVNVSEKGRARFENLSFTSDRTAAISVVHEGTRAEFSGLLVEGRQDPEADGESSVSVYLGAEAFIGNARITGGRRNGLTLNSGARVILDGLTIEDVRVHGISVKESALNGRSLVFRGVGGNAVRGTDARLTLSDVEIGDQPPETEGAWCGLRAWQGSLEVDGLRVSGLTGAAVGAWGCRANLTGVTVENSRSGIGAEEDSTVRVDGFVCSRVEANMVTALSGSVVEVVDAKLTDNQGYGLAFADAGDLTLRSVSISGSGYNAVGVDNGGSLTLEDVDVRNSSSAGLMVADAESRATLRRSRITGNALAGVQAHPDAVVEMRDVVLRDNEGGDWVYSE
ncbi:right-handed parallel beta-helix repeat-containing protein [Nocardiopsis exhalans]|uniref:Right-handed parallel beta-helix repeat-containing protein n=1 Tax=Nocardiopsis exhalans TaxID=163604 RepID=A0ABY5D977_9ACTN|nr:right-handed parallel beta-helix repeat-containing protein [Nocardiopsis exhalans]USY20897.1 right-handed parallel beta-helix repeat-containing protein [Nocardiopsis exhalans]